MGTLLMILSTLTAILLIVIVLLQNSKGGGLDSSFGNASQLGGVAQSTETIEKATWTLAGVMGLLSLLAAFNFVLAALGKFPVNNPGINSRCEKKEIASST